jgi:hypothetical protein
MNTSLIADALLMTGNHGWYIGSGFVLVLIVVAVILLLRR